MTQPIPKRARTRARIVHEAAKLLRDKGLAGASLEEIMDAAELTRGGFYAHFADKNALVAEALEVALQNAREALFFSVPAGSTGREWLEFAVEKYLSEAHLREATERFPGPTLAGEMPGASAATRAIFTRNFKENVELTQRLAEVEGPEARESVLHMLSAWVGAALLARAVDDDAFAKEILAATRVTSKRQLDPAQKKPPRARSSRPKSMPPKG